MPLYSVCPSLRRCGDDAAICIGRISRCAWQRMPRIGRIWASMTDDARKMKYTKVLLWLILIVAIIPAQGASAEIFYGSEPPYEDWGSRDLMRLTAFKTGQSDCMLLEANGEVMMVDAGFETYRDDLIPALEELGIEGFKYLFNTHFHEDHIGGFYWLMKHGFTVGEYLHPYEESSRENVKRHNRTLTMAEKMNIPIRQIFDGTVLELGEAVIRLYRHEEEPNANAKSVIAHVTYGSSTILLGADIIGITQRHFAANLAPEQLRADIVKAPHHGITAMAAEFIEAIDPEMILFTAPSRRAGRGIGQAKRRKLEYLCSGDGTVILETDGADWYVRQRRKAF